MQEELMGLDGAGRTHGGVFRRPAFLKTGPIQLET